MSKKSPIPTVPAALKQSKDLDLAISAINKNFGENVLIRLGERPKGNIPVISTGDLGLDIALGVGGLPKGRIIEIYGPESSGKSTLALSVIAQAQKAGGTCAFIDAEHALDPNYARRIGVDVDNLLFTQPDCGEDALNIAESLIRSNSIAVVVIDSVAALVPKSELEGQMGDSSMGVQARLMSQAMRRLTGITNTSQTIVIFINQIREKIGVMFGCVPHQTAVMLSDGSFDLIGNIVNAKKPVEVLSWNTQTHVFEPKRVTRWFKNGVDVDQFSMSYDALAATKTPYRTFTLQDQRQSTKEFTCTPNHVLFMQDGEVHAEDVYIGDKLLVRDGAVAAAWEVIEVRDRFITGSQGIRYNLEVEGNANYVLANGVLVHNSPETTSGGRALKFFSSVRLDIRRKDQLKKTDGTVIGNLTKVKVVKNKVAPPFTETEFEIIYAEGISAAGSLLDLGIKYGFFEKKGAWISYNGELIGQGREAARDHLKANPEIMQKVREMVIDKALPKGPVQPIEVKDVESEE